MIRRSERPRCSASRVHGRGALMRSLRALLRPVQRYGEHRATSPDELRWMAQLYDGLSAVFDEAMASDGARASLRAVDERRRISSKTAGRVEPGAGVLSDAG
jgi:hypothetical protein